MQLGKAAICHSGFLLTETFGDLDDDVQNDADDANGNPHVVRSTAIVAEVSAAARGLVPRSGF